MVKLLLRDDEVEYCSGCPDLEFGYNILGGKIPQVPLIIENTGSSLQFIQSYGGRGKSGLNSFRGKFHCSLFQCDQHALLLDQRDSINGANRVFFFYFYMNSKISKLAQA